MMSEKYIESIKTGTIAVWDGEVLPLPIDYLVNYHLMAIGESGRYRDLTTSSKRTAVDLVMSSDKQTIKMIGRMIDSARV